MTIYLLDGDFQETETILGCLNKGMNVVVYSHNKFPVEDFPDLKITNKVLIYD